MAKRNRKEKEKESGKQWEKKAAWHADLHPETKKGILAVVFWIAAILFALSYIGKGGDAGQTLYRVFDFLLGRGYFFAPLTLIIIGLSLFHSREKKIVGATLLGGVLFLLAILSGFHIVIGAGTGGFLGRALGGLLLKMFDFWASVVILLGLLVISLLLTLNIPLFRKREDVKEIVDEEVGVGAGETGNLSSVLENINHSIKTVLEKTGVQGQEGMPATPSNATTISEGTPQATNPLIPKDEPLISVRKIAKKFDYTKPPLELLQGDRGKPTSGDIKANANIIKRTLENFGIDVEMGEVAIGPTVTQYTLRPAEGVKLARITALHNDLSLALAAHPIRIEAPIPGKPLVGIEVPNRSIATVGLRTLLESKTFQESTQPLLFVLGRDVTGTPIFADLARMPHLLVSGATGSGKSVAIHTIITSFLYRNPPEILRFILVDPKRVELSVYNDIPHLLTPVITDPKKTIQALRWATKEMDRRYDLLSSHQARDIVSYNSIVAKSQDPETELLPYIVIMIDELADLMATFPREVESSIIRLAQMARAVGIHLMVATQRPSVEVITGLIKANITSRIALQVASQIDSRTILDMAGAEKLLGNGDMLFLAGDTAKSKRIQGAFVSEHEIKRVVDFLREEVEAPEYDEAILETKIEEGAGATVDGFVGDGDPLYEEAMEAVLGASRASASFLQRRLRVGYARAARLLDLMESRGVIGPGEGAKPREILLKQSEPKDAGVLEE